MTFTNEKAEIRAHEIEKTKAEIQVLTKKLYFLEDMQKRQKSPAEIAFKRVYGHYPVTDIADTCWEGQTWFAFQEGYNATYEETVSKYQPTAQTPEEEQGTWNYDPDAKFRKQDEVNTLQESNWYVDPKTLLKYNWESTQVSVFKYNQRTYIRYEDMGLFAWLIVDKADPIEDEDTLKILENEMNKQKEEYPYKKYTPEETEKSLKDAMKTAQSEGVFDEPETLTLKQLLKKWEIDFSAKWEYPRNKTSKVYEEEVERFIQMFMEWMPDTIGDIQDDWDDGYNSYRNALMEKLK